MRRISLFGAALTGLPELVDNNPMVCASEFSVLSPVATLTHLGLAPLLLAGLVLEAPVVLSNVDEDEDAIGESLRAIYGWQEGVLLTPEPMDLQGCLAVNVMAAIPTPADLDVIDGLYEECFGRSFFVERNEAEDWDVKNVMETAKAEYRLRISPDDDVSILTIQTMADLNGKCGAGQAVHVMNIMAGFEETLGLT